MEHNFSETDERAMRLALAEARRAAEAGEIPIGAVVADIKGNIIGKGNNQTVRLKDPTAHAEMLAITAAMSHAGSPYLSDYTLYVTIEPCAMCAGAIRWARVGRLVFGAPEPKVGFSRYTPSLLHPRTECQSHLMADECAALMRDFFSERR